MTHLDRLDSAVGLEITAVHGVEAVLARLVAADDHSVPSATCASMKKRTGSATPAASPCLPKTIGPM